MAYGNGLDIVNEEEEGIKDVRFLSTGWMVVAFSKMEKRKSGSGFAERSGETS